MVGRPGLKRISSTGHPIVKLVLELKSGRGRRKHGLIIIEGLRAAEAAIHTGTEIKSAVVTPEAATEGRAQFIIGLLQKQGIKVYEARAKLFGRVSDVETPQGLLLICPSSVAGLGEALSGDFVLIADGIQDPGNLGTILRCARAFGVDGLIATRGTVEVANPKTMRAAAGAWPGFAVAEHIAVELLVSELKGRGYSLLISDREGCVDFRQADWRGRVALALGGEAHGVSMQLREAGTDTIRIPHLGKVESLNVGAAAAILMAEAFHRRSQGR